MTEPEPSELLIDQFINSINENISTYEGEKYSTYYLDIFASIFLYEQNLTDNMKHELDRLDKEANYIDANILPYKIKDDVMEHLAKCGEWTFAQINPYTNEVRFILLQNNSNNSNYNKINKQYLKLSDPITNQNYQKQVSSSEEFNNIFGFNDGGLKRRRKKKSKRNKSQKKRKSYRKKV